MCENLAVRKYVRLQYYTCIESLLSDYIKRCLIASFFFPLLLLSHPFISFDSLLHGIDLIFIGLKH